MVSDALRGACSRFGCLRCDEERLHVPCGVFSFLATASGVLQGQSRMSRSLAYRIVTSRLARGHRDGWRLHESQCMDLPERRDLPARKPHPRLSLNRPYLARGRGDDRPHARDRMASANAKLDWNSEFAGEGAVGHLR